MLAPVVENPDIVSKKASVKSRGVSQSMNGINPKKEKTTHTSAVSRNPSRLAMLDDAGRMQNVIIMPEASVTATAMRKAQKSCSS